MKLKENEFVEKIVALRNGSPQREALIDIIRAEGYDMISASEMADNTIQEFLEGQRNETTYYFKSGRGVILRRK